MKIGKENLQMSVNSFAKYCMQGSGRLIINRIVYQPVKIDYNLLYRCLWIVFASLQDKLLS